MGRAVNTPPEVLAAILFAPGRLPPAADRDAAVKRIRYGLAALTEAPAGGGLTPADRLADEPAFRAGLDAVERFLDMGRWPDPDVVAEFLREGCDRVGRGECGTGAAATGVCLLARAVDRLHDDPPDLAVAAGLAEEAADCAARAGDGGYTADSVNYLERLQIRMYGLPHAPRPVR